MIELLKNAAPKWPIGSSLTPIEGPRIIPLTLDFSKPADNTYSIDGNNICNFIKNGQDISPDISMVQSLYIDLSTTDSVLIVTVDKSGQKIIAKGRTQGYYPVSVPNLWKLSFKCDDVVATKVQVILCNYAVSPGVWAATI